MKVLFLGNNKQAEQIIKRNYDSVDVNPKNKDGYDIVFWFLDNDDGLYDFKNKNPKSMLIVYEDKLAPIIPSFAHIFKMKSNIIIQKKDKYSVIDPLGNMWYEGENIIEAIQSSIDRIEFLRKIKRESTIQADEEIGSLAWYFNQFKQEFINEKVTDKNVDATNYLNVIKQYARVFTKETLNTDEIDKALQSSATRCIKGMPSFKSGNIIFVSKRTVDNKYIQNEDLIPMIMKNGKLLYQGKYKPSVDSPIHIELYKHFTNINYILHSHCYIDNAVFTEKNYPCGAIEEVEEILKTIKEHYGTFNNNFYMINLIGHGSYVMGNNIDDLKGISYIGRKLPEKMF